MKTKRWDCVCCCFPATGVWHYQQSSESWVFLPQQESRDQIQRRRRRCLRRTSAHLRISAHLHLKLEVGLLSHICTSVLETWRKDCTRLYKLILVPQLGNYGQDWSPQKRVNRDKCYQRQKLHTNKPFLLIRCLHLCLWTEFWRTK